MQVLSWYFVIGESDTDFDKMPYPKAGVVSSLGTDAVLPQVSFVYN